jgi:hypothetical protein
MIPETRNILEHLSQKTKPINLLHELRGYVNIYAMPLTIPENASKFPQKLIA